MTPTIPDRCQRCGNRNMRPRALPANLEAPSIFVCGSCGQFEYVDTRAVAEADPIAVIWPDRNAMVPS